MAVLNYAPAGGCCKCCGKRFAEGEHIVWDALYERSLCAECADDGGDDENVNYIMIGSEARLLAERRNIVLLNVGVCEICENDRGEHYFTEADDYLIRDRDIDCTSKILICGESADAVFFMKSDGYPYDFFEDPETAEELVFYANLIGQEHACFIVSEDNTAHEARVMGMMNTHGYGDPEAAAYDIFLPISDCEFMQMRYFKEDFENRHLDITLGRILKKLTPKIMFDYISDRVRGQEEALKSALYLVYRYLQCIAQKKTFTADSWMITAPSGSGKTEFYRSVKDLFAQYGITIPVAQIDLSQITEAGFKGNNPDTIIKRLASMNKELGGYAICLLDEADKKFTPSITSGGNNVNAAIQSNLLTLIEGIEEKVEIGDETVDFDTNKTMFIFMGAFQEVRDKKQKNKLRKGMGFGSELEKRDFTEKAHSDFYDDIGIQDMIDFGMLEEIAGRLVRVVNFRRLPEDEMARLIRDKAKLIGSEYGCAADITDEAVNEIVGLSYGTIGIRKPINLIKQVIQDTMADAMFGDGFDEKHDRVLITGADKAMIVKNKPAAKNAKKKSKRPEKEN